MGSKLAVTDNGIHKIAKKIFLTDDKLVHRKVKKKFLTQNGVHRMIYSSGTKWAKYSCSALDVVFQYQETDSLGDDVSVGNVEVWETSYLSFCSDYTFHQDSGFMNSGEYGYAETAEELSSASGYIVESESVWSILSVSVLSDDGEYCTAEVEVELVALCEAQTYPIYEQGSEYFGIVEAEDGEFPGSGSLIEIGPNDSYCVRSEEHIIYYYYVKIEE